ncbi:MAG: type II toxin-antitoxin system VapC family toxin [Gemmatimonadota bacterium]
MADPGQAAPDATVSHASPGVSFRSSPDPSPPILLDTHVWIWAAEGNARRLPPRVLAALDRASQEGRLRVAAISVWEVGLLEARNRLAFNRPVADWVQAALTAPGVQLYPLAPEVALESTRLPGEPPTDPADRMIIATARHGAATLCTADAPILRYGEAGHVRVLSAR